MGDSERRPARGYAWDPFTKGHTKSLKHGAWSPRTVEPVVAAYLDAVTAAAADPTSTVSYLADPSYRPALTAWATCEARCDLLRAWLTTAGDIAGLDDEGQVRPAAQLLDRLEGQALKHRERLGLDPLARARLGKDIAGAHVDLARLMAEHDDQDNQ